MPFFGGLTPWPLRFGGGVPRMQSIVSSLQAARGQLYSTSATSAVYVENNAIARAIDRDGYGCNERLANQFYPETTTSLAKLGPGYVGVGLLARWESIFGIVPAPQASDPVRRAPVVAAWQRLVGYNNAQGLLDVVSGVLTPYGIFVGVVTFGPTTGAVSYWPAAPNPVPDPNIPTPWMSTISHIDIQVQQPAGMLEGEFLSLVAQAMASLDGLLPVWVTFDWFTVDTVAGVNGFYLDSYENLLRDVFDV